jgi:acetyltransferase-like isoleucine patch superfamily enzyme/acyl carrier protein
VRRWLDRRFRPGRPPRPLRACTEVGPGAQLRGRPHVVNRGAIVIGARFHLASQPIRSHLITGATGDLRIGDDVTIDFGAAIACESRVSIGDGSVVGPLLALADSDFHVVGDRNARPEPRPVAIGRNVRIGARVTVLPGAVIGDGAVVTAGSAVAGTVPAGAVVAGVPARRVAGQAGESAVGPVADAVREFVKRTFSLARLPELEQGRADFVEWDSLGALRLLLALEEEFAVRVSEEEIGDVQRVGDIVALVEGRPLDGSTEATFGAAPEISTAGDTGVDEPSAVAELVRSVLGLDVAPPPASGPAEIPAWDSLGGLQILLAAEEEFGVTLDESVMVDVGSVADLTEAIRRAPRRHQAVVER